MTEETPQAADVLDIPSDPVKRLTYVIRDDEHATKVMRQMRGIRRRQRELTRIHESEARQLREELGIVEQWLADANRVPDAEIRYREGILGQYALRVRTETRDRRKSVVLPWGRIETTSKQASFQITDKDAVVKWAEDNGHHDVIKEETKKTPLISKANQYLEDAGGLAFDHTTGGVVPGIAVNPAAINFTVILDQE